MKNIRFLINNLTSIQEINNITSIRMMELNVHTAQFVLLLDVVLFKE